MPNLIRLHLNDQDVHIFFSSTLVKMKCKYNMVCQTRVFSIPLILKYPCNKEVN